MMPWTPVLIVGEKNLVWPVLYLPKGEPKYQKLDYWTADLAGLLRELQADEFSGYVEILSPHQHGLFLFHTGRLCNCFYDGTEELQLTHPQVVEYFLQKKRRGPETAIHVMTLAPAVLEALSALETRRPLYRELETSFLDMEKLFDTLDAKHFTGFLRFYRIRSHTRLGNILIKMNKISREQLQEAVRLQLSRKNGMRLGDALVQTGAISAQDLDSALDLQSHARKGSDVEIGLALFRSGEFLGGYSHMHKQFGRNRDEILTQMVGTEVLLDITEGSLPDPIDLQTLLTQDAPRPEAPLESARREPAAGLPRAGNAPQPPTLDLSSERVMILRNEDLFLDLRDLPEAPEPKESEAVPPIQPVQPGSPVPSVPPVPPEAAGLPDEIAEAVTVLEPPAETPVSIPEEAVREVEAPPPSRYWVSEELKGLDYVQAVVDKFMGPLGCKLLEREMKMLGIPGREWNGDQLRDLNQRLEKSARLILGVQQARKMYDKIMERLES